MPRVVTWLWLWMVLGMALSILPLVNILHTFSTIEGAVWFITIVLMPVGMVLFLKALRLNPFWSWIALPLISAFAFGDEHFEWLICAILGLVPFFSGATLKAMSFAYLPLAICLLIIGVLPNSVDLTAEAGLVVSAILLGCYFFILKLKDTAPIANWATILLALWVTIWLLRQNLQWFTMLS